MTPTRIKPFANRCSARLTSGRETCFWHLGSHLRKLTIRLVLRPYHRHPMLAVGMMTIVPDPRHPLRSVAQVQFHVYVIPTLRQVIDVDHIGVVDQGEGFDFERLFDKVCKVNGGKTGGEISHIDQCECLPTRERLDGGGKAVGEHGSSLLDSLFYSTHRPISPWHKFSVPVQGRIGSAAEAQRGSFGAVVKDRQQQAPNARQGPHRIIGSSESPYRSQLGRMPRLLAKALLHVVCSMRHKWQISLRIIKHHHLQINKAEHWQDVCCIIKLHH